MKILHIQYGMPPAGNACFRLHSAMRAAGVESSVLTIMPSVKRNNVYNVKQDITAFAKKVISLFQTRYIDKRKKEGSYFYSPLPIWGTSLHSLPVVQQADAIYLHWIAGASLSLSEVGKIAATGKPVFFFLHDMWALTGGCHHAFECDGYRDGCKNCPMFAQHENMPSKQLCAKKRLYRKYPNIVFIAPSQWMAECAKLSDASKYNPISVISNVVDETNFKPIDKDIARDILNLPKDKTIITFGCQAGTKNKFKGWSYLKDAMNMLSSDNIHVLVYGSDYSRDTAEQIPYPITFLGPIFDETKLSLVCNATDVFVSPSLAESFGLTFLENSLCGTPVVGFDNTAIGEIIHSGKNGYLAKNKDANDLAKGIDIMIPKKGLVTGFESYSAQKLVQQHINIINKYLKK